MCRGWFTSVQSHGGHVYAALPSRERKGSFVRVYNPSAWPWIQLREIRLPCDGVHSSLWTSAMNTYTRVAIMKIQYSNWLMRVCWSAGTASAVKVKQVNYARHSYVTVTRTARCWWRIAVTAACSCCAVTGSGSSPVCRCSSSTCWPVRAVYTRERLYVLGYDTDQIDDFIYLYEPTHEQEPSSEDNQETSTGDESTSADDSWSRMQTMWFIILMFIRIIPNWLQREFQMQWLFRYFF